jgi:hypothetical protein
MKRLFVDTGAWYAVVDKKDPDHNQAELFLRNNKTPLLTTNFIFDEAVTLIRSRLGWNAAKDFGTNLKGSSFAGIIKVRDEDEENAWRIFLKFKDQDYSFTDCTSFAVMERLKIDTAFSFDSHFESMRFRVVPS